MADERISALDNASAAELTDDTVIIVNTPLGLTKKTTWGNIKKFATCGIQCASVELSSAEILDLFTNPKIVVPSQGPNTIIDPVSAFIKYDHGGTDYTTMGTLYLVSGGTANFVARCNDVLYATSSIVSKFEMLQGIDLGNLAVDEDLFVIPNITNPADGDGTATIYVFYRVIQF